MGEDRKRNKTNKKHKQEKKTNDRRIESERNEENGLYLGRRSKNRAKNPSGGRVGSFIGAEEVSSERRRRGSKTHMLFPFHYDFNE